MPKLKIKRGKKFWINSLEQHGKVIDIRRNEHSLEEEVTLKLDDGDTHKAGPSDLSK